MEGVLIHFDTEQGAWHTQRVAKRIVDMSEWFFRMLLYL